MSHNRVIKWTGSKRFYAEEIISLFPSYDTYHEPFIGGGSIMREENPDEAICGDRCEPLIGFWRTLRDDHRKLEKYYYQKWSELQKEGEEVYYQTRDQFNEEKRPDQLLFLTRTCTNGLIRFNNDGEFNVSYHIGRPGIDPKRLSSIIRRWSKAIQDIEFRCRDYRKSVKDISEGDLVYLDPPYADAAEMYFGGIDLGSFKSYLQEIDDKGAYYVLNFDGTRDGSDFFKLEDHPYEEHMLLSTQRSGMNRVTEQEHVEVRESLYTNYDLDSIGREANTALDW